MRAFICLILLVASLTPALYSQQTKLSKFIQLSRPEKFWVLSHPFVLKKSFEITHETISITDSLYQLNELDQIANGGKIDAFRHGYWMYSLTKEIGPKKALSLGNSHERGNEIDYRRGRLEEGLIPDSVSIQMDYLNNSIAVKKAQTHADNYNSTEVISIIIAMINQGELFIIKMDDLGNSLDESGNIIPQNEWKGHWKNSRCLTHSN